MSLHQIGNLHYLRGEYDQALAKYEESLSISEDVGNRVVAAVSLTQIGTLFAKTGRYKEAFDRLIRARGAFLEFGSPYAVTALNALRALRSAWGGENFDPLWKKATGEDVPDFADP